jgi:hypothetical protein
MSPTCPGSAAIIISSGPIFSTAYHISPQRLILTITSGRG